MSMTDWFQDLFVRSLATCLMMLSLGVKSDDQLDDEPVRGRERERESGLLIGTSAGWYLLPDSRVLIAH